jgi:hypothetical protein
MRLLKNQMEKREMQIKNRKLMITVFYITYNRFRSLVSLFSLIFVKASADKSLYSTYILSKIIHLLAVCVCR